MKELSIEEKAKRYDKAFIKSSEFLTLCEKCGAKDTVEFIEDIFPELKMDKESEDERIRKEIIDYIDKATGCKRWVAWLEKQGEQKSFDYENANIPQKDSTWSEEDKHWMQKVIDFMNHPDLIKATPTLAKDTINWLKSLKVRVHPQSKQEWSKEDESNFQMIVDVIIENKHHSTDYEHMIYYKLLSWLKSLKDRYTWKPSDEQMKVCKEVYADLLSAKGFDVGTINSELNRLEEKLK